MSEDTRPECDQFAHCHAQFATILQRLDNISHQQGTIAKLLTGNGSPEQGLLIRFDRIEQGMDRRQRREWAVFGAALSAVIAVVVKLLRG